MSLLRILYSFTVVLWPHRCKPCWLSELFVLGPVSEWSLKRWVLHVGSKHFAPQGEASPNCMILWWGCGLWRVYVSISFPFDVGDMGILAWCGEVSNLISAFLSEEIVLCVAVDSMYPWDEVSSGGSYVAILDWNPL